VRILLAEFHPSGGLFHFSFQLGAALAVSGHRVELLTGPQPELESTVPGFEVIPLFRTWHPRGADLRRSLLHRVRRVVRAMRYLDAWRRLLAYVDRNDVDAVAWSEFKSPVVGWFVPRLARTAHRPVLAFIAHEPRPLAARRRRGQLYHTRRSHGRARALGSMDVVFVLGPNARRELLDTWPEIRHVEVIPHGGQEIFPNDAAPAPGQCPPTAVFFGTWTRSKGLDLLLDAFAIVRSRVPAARLVIAGAVAANVDRDALRRRADEIGGVDLRPGYVPMTQVAPLIGRARLIAVPYVRAAQSGVVHLAQTFARPVVATAVGDIRQAVRDGVCGRLVPPGDALAFAAAMEELLCDPATATAMGQAGKERLAAEASWHEVASRFARALADVRQGRYATP
jgi:glycosyltransferase involved in cell wall biosynthesis